MKAWEYVHSFTQALQALSSSSSAQTKLDVKFPSEPFFHFGKSQLKWFQLIIKKKIEKGKEGNDLICCNTSFLFLFIINLAQH